ncbi:MAG: hypothetical protein ACREQ5_27395, partial [Candidatus Dormibacteria bacterium]
AISSAGTDRRRVWRRLAETDSRGVIPHVVAAALRHHFHIPITVLHRSVTSIDAFDYPFSATTYSM